MENVETKYLTGNQYINYKVGSEQLNFIVPPIFAEERDLVISFNN